MSVIGKLGKYAPVVLASLLLVACGGDTDIPKVGKKKKATTATAAATSTPATAATPTVGVSQVNVVVDASTGMRGFMRPNQPGEPGSDFQRRVSALLSGFHAQRAQQPAPPAYYFVQESTAQDPRVLRPTTYAELTNTVSTGIKNPAAGTELPAMLREVLKLQKARPGTLSVVISDFIYAPPNASETWRVKTDVQDALSEVPAAKLALRVFAGTSAFRDKFFPGNRTRFQVLSGSRIPYYIWVLGEPATVAAAEAAGLLRPLAGPEFERVAYQTASGTAVAFEHFQNVGQWYVEKGGSAPVPLRLAAADPPTRKAPLEFVLGLDLRHLPADAQASLPRLARLDPGEALATLVKVWAVATEPKAPVSKALPTYTHLAKVRVERLPAGRPTTLRLVLPRAVPAWVAHYSTTNDSDIAAQGPKTFLFSEVMQGVQDYYDQQPTGREAWSLPVQVRLAD